MAQIPLRVGTRSLDTGSVVQYPTGDPIGKAVEVAGEQAAKVGRTWEEELVRRNAKIERFTTLRDYDNFNTDVLREVDTAKQNMQPGAIGFHDTLLQTFDKKSEEWLGTVPESLKPEMQARLATRRGQFSRDVATVEATESNRFQTNVLVQKVDEAKKGVLELGDQSLEQWTKDVEDRIDASALSPAVKADMKLVARREMQKAGFIALKARDPAAAQAITSQWTGGPESVSARIVQAESGGVDNAANPSSSARGAGQFIESTWLQMIRTYRPELAQGRSKEDILALRSDGKLSREMTQRYAEENAARLKSANIATTPGNIYLAHFLGPDDAKRILSVSPDQPVANFIGSDKIAANPKVLEGKTVGDVVAWANRKMGAGGEFVPAAARDPRFQNLSFDDVATLSGQTEKQRADLITAAQTALEKQDQLNHDNALKEAFALSEKNALTPEHVETIRPLLKPTEYQNMLRALREDAPSDDKDAMADLVPKIDTMNPDEFQKAITPYLQAGKLKTGTYMSLSEKNRAASRDDAPASPYKSGRSVVNTTLDPGQLLSGPAAAIARSAQAQALIEYDNWARANPRADRSETVTQAQDIIRRYQIVPFDEMKLAIGTSPYFGNKSRNEIVSDDIAQAEQKLLQDMNANKLTPDQSAFEIRRLQSWRDVLARQKAAADVAERAKAKK